MVLGLVIGSFLNVCIYRIPNGESIVSPPSACGHCHTRLKAKDLVPVLSYLTLKGRCRYCGEHISFQYPMIELLNAVLYVAAYYKYGYTIETLFAWIMISLLIVMSVIDLEHMIIPNELVLFGLVTGAFTSTYHMFYGNDIYFSGNRYNGFIGMLSASVILLVIALVSMKLYGDEGGMGFGDVKIFLPIGLFLGWQLTLLALWLSFILGGIFGLLLLIVFKKDRRMAMPFGPFIGLGSLVSLLFGKSFIIIWILGL